jgi:hypothetical protein
MKDRIAAFLVCFFLIGSIVTGCGGTTRVETTNSVTLGQQLTDLDKAYKDGVITEKEYNKAKESMLKQYK